MFMKLKMAEEQEVVTVSEENLDNQEDNLVQKTCPVNSDETNELKNVTINDIDVFRYTEKSILTRGNNTKFLKDKLKQLGGRYNVFKTGPGWIFSIKHYNKLVEFLNSDEAKELIATKKAVAQSSETQTVLYRVQRPKLGQSVLVISDKEERYTICQLKEKKFIDTVYITTGKFEDASQDDNVLQLAVINGEWKVLYMKEPHQIKFV